MLPVVLLVVVAMVWAGHGAGVEKGSGTFIIKTSASGRDARLMATLPLGVIDGINEELRVYEDIQDPGTPIVFVGTSGFRAEITKSGEPQVC